MKKLLWLFIFGVAMGYLEAAVVVYLREICCPGGFSFPLSLPQTHIYLTELVRELATLVMLIAISFLLGKDRVTRFAYFCFAFSIWDIFYYVGLYFLIGWPASLLTWDILFSIPVSWVAPVIAPVIVSMFLIVSSMGILSLSDKGYVIKTSFLEKAAVFGGLFLVFLSMTVDVFKDPMYCVKTAEANMRFHWGLFFSGMLITALAMIRIYNNIRIKSARSVLTEKS